MTHSRGRQDTPSRADCQTRSVESEAGDSLLPGEDAVQAFGMKALIANIEAYGGATGGRGNPVLIQVTAGTDYTVQSKCRGDTRSVSPSF